MVFLTSFSRNPLASNTLARCSISGCLLVLSQIWRALSRIPRITLVSILGWCMVRMARDVPVRVGRFPAHCSGQLAFAVCHQDIQECKPPLFLFLNCELNVGGHLIEVCMEELQVPLSMGPDNEVH